MNQPLASTSDADSILQLLDATVVRARRERAAWEAQHPSVCVDDRRQAVANLPLQRDNQGVA